MIFTVMAAQYSVNNIQRGVVPEITVDSSWATDYPVERIQQHGWDTPYDYSSSPEGHSETEERLSLEDQLWRSSVDHANRGTPSFWPPSVWKGIVTKQAIADELESLPGYGRREAENIAERVWQDKTGTCVQIFTILVLIDKVELLVKHILGCKEGVRDHDLPLVLKNRHGRGHGNSKLCRRDSKAVCCFSGWKTATLEQFERFQRGFTVPIFRLDRRTNALIHLDLDAKDILPWCDEAEIPPVNAMSGGSGTVIRVKIHPRCHEFHDTLKAVCPALIILPLTVD